MLLILGMSCTSIGLIMTWRSNSELSDGLVECQTLLKVEVLDRVCLAHLLAKHDERNGLHSSQFMQPFQLRFAHRGFAYPLWWSVRPAEKFKSLSLLVGRKVCDAGFIYKGHKLPTLQPHNTLEICRWLFQINSMIETWTVHIDRKKSLDNIKVFPQSGISNNGVTKSKNPSLYMVI
jgi:hypothetical protein